MSSSYNRALTAAEILTQILSVDGAGSGLSADNLDGHDTSYFLPAATYTAANVLSKMLTVDGLGSTLDADKVRGKALEMMYCGTGVGIGFPSGWSYTKLATGLYRVTHNLDRAIGSQMFVVGTPALSTVNRSVQLEASTVNSFDISIKSSSDAYVNESINLLVGWLY